MNRQARIDAGYEQEAGQPAWSEWEQEERRMERATGCGVQPAGDLDPPLWGQWRDLEIASLGLLAEFTDLYRLCTTAAKPRAYYDTLQEWEYAVAVARVLRRRGIAACRRRVARALESMTDLILELSIRSERRELKSA